MEPVAQPPNDAGQALLFRLADVAAADEVFAAILQVEGVVDVGLTKPGAKHPRVRSMAYAQLDGTVDAAEACAKVADIPGVLGCEISAPRYLL